MIELTRAAAQSKDVIAVIAVREGAEIYAPDARAFQYRRDAVDAEHWFYEDFDLSIQDVTYFSAPKTPTDGPHFALLSAEGEVFHFSKPERYQEIITAGDSKNHGRMLKLRQIGHRLFACGAGGQLYVRQDKDRWAMLTDALLHDPEAAENNLKQEEPKAFTPEWFAWIEKRVDNPVTRDVIFNDVAGLSKEAIYVCGEEGSKPVLGYWDGSDFEELKLHLPEGALTGIYIEHADSVWVCGREGILLHGSHARGFTPVNLRDQLNLFHTITPYRGKLILPSSVRPGGLFEVDPVTSEFRRFSPALPKLRGDYIFYAGAADDVLWVVGQKDIFRFDGREWERVEHPDL